MNLHFKAVRCALSNQPSKVHLDPLAFGDLPEQARFTGYCHTRARTRAHEHASSGRERAPRAAKKASAGARAALTARILWHLAFSLKPTSTPRVPPSVPPAVHTPAFAVVCAETQPQQRPATAASLRAAPLHMILGNGMLGARPLPQVVDGWRAPKRNQNQSCPSVRVRVYLTILARGLLVTLLARKHTNKKYKRTSRITRRSSCKHAAAAGRARTSACLCTAEAQDCLRPSPCGVPWCKQPLTTMWVFACAARIRRRQVVA